MTARILLIEDDPAFRDMLLEALRGKGWEVEPAGSAEQGLDQLAGGGFDLVLTDVKLPGMTGLEALPRLKEADPEADVIVMTAFSTREMAVEAVRQGAADFFSKPFSLAEMEVVIRRTMERRGLAAEVRALRRTLGQGGPVDKIIGQSAPMGRVKALAAKVAPLETTVLVTGESGTGKELIAETLHALSPRAGKPMVRVNCAAIPDNLLESELFGHEKGAFTGALSAKPGKFELAQGGTILLDEIGDMPLAVQPKLLRAVEQKQVERLGGSRTLDVDVRIVAATNQDLEELARERKFREDLYYRLNVASLHLPPLRERKEDLPLLAEHFLARINLKLGTDYGAVSGDAMEELFGHDWPGNVRQLANVLERAAILGEGSVLSREAVGLAFSRDMHLADVAVPGETGSLKETMREVEKNLILSALRRAGGRQTEAAKLLGLSPKNLWNKLQKHAIDPSNLG